MTATELENLHDLLAEITDRKTNALGWVKARAWIERCWTAETDNIRLREALDLIATKPFTAAMDAREMQNIARAALASDRTTQEEPT